MRFTQPNTNKEFAPNSNKNDARVVIEMMLDGIMKFNKVEYDNAVKTLNND